MKTQKWTTVDKAEWPRGPWTSEPDKMQWQDEATGLPCLIVRNNGGALCGYVGLAEGHPLHGLDYNACPHGDTCPDRKGDESYYYCDHRPESRLRVHGGITFADFCGEHTREKWEKFRARKADWEREARRYPVGDSARRLKEWAGTFDDYDAWTQRAQATGICHIPAPGEPERVWWFGFDCSHAGDFSPGYQSILNQLGQPTGWGTTVEYCDIDYVQRECAELARQLAAIA